MENPKIIINVRNIPNVAERLKKVSAGIDKVESEEYAEIISDDERMLQLTPKMIQAIGKVEFIRSWKRNDGFYHTLIKKKD